MLYYIIISPFSQVQAAIKAADCLRNFYIFHIFPPVFPCYFHKFTFYARKYTLHYHIENFSDIM